MTTTMLAMKVTQLDGEAAAWPVQDADARKLTCPIKTSSGEDGFLIKKIKCEVA